LAAIKAVQEGIKLSLQEGLEIEKKLFVEVALTNEAKGSMNTFFLKTMTDKPLSMVPRDFKAKPVKKAAVLGFGIMGRGIVIDILRTMQIPVVVKDMPESLEAGKKFVKKILDGMAEKKKIKITADELMQFITLTSEINDDFKDADIVIEAITENPQIKTEVYKELCCVVPSDCIICSNTSSIPITKLAQSVTNPERFAGAHFFSPVWLMELLEIVKGEATSQETVDNLLCFAGAIKKRPIICRDNPGFVVNAMIIHYFLKVYDLLEQGVPIEKIDGL
jgi:3-hydroxyacyl-CoA dehydrogenase